MKTVDPKAWKGTVFGSLPPGASDYELIKQRKKRKAKKK